MYFCIELVSIISKYQFCFKCMTYYLLTYRFQHIYCNACLHTWLKVQKKCPSCKLVIYKREIHEVRRIQNGENVSSEDLQMPKQKSLSKSKSFPFPILAKLPNIAGSYSTKIELILRHIKFLVGILFGPLPCSSTHILIFY